MKPVVPVISALMLSGRRAVSENARRDATGDCVVRNRFSDYGPRSDLCTTSDRDPWQYHGSHSDIAPGSKNDRQEIQRCRRDRHVTPFVVMTRTGDLDAGT